MRGQRSPPPRLSSLHDPDEGLNELDEGLLALVAHLGARGRGLGLAGGQDAAGRRGRRASAEVARQAGEEGALGGRRGRQGFKVHLKCTIYPREEEHSFLTRV